MQSGEHHHRRQHTHTYLRNSLQWPIQDFQATGASVQLRRKRIMYRTHSRHSYKPSNSSTSKFLECFSASVLLSMYYRWNLRNDIETSRSSQRPPRRTPQQNLDRNRFPSTFKIDIRWRRPASKMSKVKPCLLHEIPLQFPPVRSQMHARNGNQTPAISSKFHHNNPGHRRHQTLVNTARLWCRSYYGIIATTMIDCKSFTSTKKKGAVNTHTHTQANKRRSPTLFQNRSRTKLSGWWSVQKLWRHATQRC